MKIINFLSLIAIITMLAGCSSKGTVHPSQLAKTAQINETHCYNDKIEIVEDRLNQFLKKCYISSSFTNNAIKTGNIPKGKRISLTTGTNYQYSAELRENVKQCKTQAIMYGIDKNWKETLYQSNLAAYGSAYKCP